MNFLHKLNFFDPAKTGIRNELFLASSCIDFMTLHKQANSTAQGTRIQTNMPMQHISADDKYTIERYSFMSHVIEGLPEIINRIAFDGLFIKCTVQYLKAGEMKKYTSWLNPDNICSLYSFQPDCTECFFFSGTQILISNKLPDITVALRSHNKQYKERKNQKYGNNKK